MLGNSFGDRYSLRISLILVLVGLSGLYIEIINAFEYVQGARKGFKNLMSHNCSHSRLVLSIHLNRVKDLR